MTDTFLKQMSLELGELGLSLDNRQMEQFYLYYEMLVEKNKVMNLTAITEESDVVTKHFCDSLSLLKAFPELPSFSDFSVIDVGTGAGFPGIPLKIAFPQIKVTLLDSLNKRIHFLEEVCNALGLEHVSCVHGRAEDIGRMEGHREVYDLCVSRAVANMSSLLDYCMPFVKKNGYFVPYKSGEIEAELKSAERAVGILGGELEKVVKFMLPGSDVSRCLVPVKKVKNTPKKYPRKAGMPTKEPLGK